MGSALKFGDAPERLWYDTLNPRLRGRVNL